MVFVAFWPARAGASPVTFTKDIAPLMFESCSPCHRPGGSAPFPLVSYPDVRARARQIAAVVRRRAMPPWKPEAGYGDFAGTRRLSDTQIKIVETWVEQGSLFGDARDLPPAPQWTDEWRLGTPDVVLRLTAPFKLPPGGPDRMRNFVIPVPLTASRYVKAWEFRTDAPAVVHHATMVIDPARAARRLDEEDSESGYEGLIPLSAQNPEGHFLGWTPGQTPSVSREDIAWRLDPGADLVLMLHLRPSGRWESVDASVGLYFSDGPPSKTAAMIRLNRQDIDIPAGESRYVVRDSYTLPVDVDAYGVQPHAHNLAREMKAFATLPDGSRRWLIYIRDWDFHWQDAYQYEAPVFLPAGTEVAMEYTYDNSGANPANPSHPPRRVTYGQRTTDEMADLWLQVVPRQRRDLPTLAASLRRKLVPQHIQGYRMMLRADPGNVALHDEVALLYVEAGDMKAAAAEFAESLRLRPDRPAAHYNLGNVLLMLQRAGEAERHFRAALERSPDYGLAHQGLALALQAEGRLGEAATHLEAALRTMPTPEVHYNLGMVEAALGRPASAVASYRRALAARPGWVPAQLELAWVLAVCTDASIRNASEALALAEDVVEPTARAFDVLAAAMAAAGRFDEAVANARRALAVSGGDGEAALRSAIQARLDLYLQRRPFVMATDPLR
jgi:tetratricopeptide (TPR) repeat protein